MMHFTDMTGLFGSALGIVVLGSKMLGVLGLSRVRLGWLLAAILVAVLIPIDGLSLAAYLRGTIGDLSITSLLLLLAALGSSLCGWPIPHGRNKLLLLIVCIAIGFYPLVLGWGIFDPYYLGYGDFWFMGGVLAISLLVIWRGLPMIALALALAVLAWSVGWYESNNAWDYLIDPIVAFYATGVLIKQAVFRWRVASSSARVALSRGK